MDKKKGQSVLRVLHVVGKMDTGGMETLIMNWYRNLDKSKIQFDFLTHHKEKGFYDDEIEANGGVVYRLSISNDKNYKKYKLDLDIFFSKHKEYKIVHGHHAAFGRFYLHAAKMNGIPIRIAHSHNSSYTKTIRGFLVHISSRYFGKYATDYFACSIVAGNYMYGSKAKFTVINNGIDTDKYVFSKEQREKIRTELNLNDAYTLVHVGRFFEQKNHKFLMDIFAKYKVLNPEAKLLLIGVGPLQNKIREKVKAFGLEESVLFLNQQPNVQDYLSAADLFVFPSLYEGLPLTLVEAQSSGLPVVCSDTITDETCLTEHYSQMSLKKSPELWAEKIREVSLIIHSRTNSNLLVRSKGFDCKDVIRMLENKYLSLCSNIK